MELLGFKYLYSSVFAVVVEFVDRKELQLASKPVDASLSRHQSTSHARNPVAVFLYFPHLLPSFAWSFLKMDIESCSRMSEFDLVEVDSLEALVIIDNDLDPLSTIAPDTVQVSGHLGHLATSSPHKANDRGDACKELRMEDICCSAHGLSILVV